MHPQPDDSVPTCARPHIAFVRCPLPEQADAEDWLDACYRLTSRVERVGASSALLDLGACTDEEARGAMRDLLEWLKAHGGQARAGIGKSATLAQCALLVAPRGRVLAHVTADAAPSFLRDVPVTVLARLHPAGSVTPEVVERLQRYGLRTLGHTARLGELALRRQFGAAGAALAAMVRGEDPVPLCPTPAPAWLRVRLRLDAPEPPERIVAALPIFAERASARLRLRGQRTRALRLRVSWEGGGVQSARLSLRTHTDDARILAAELRRALDSLLPPVTDTSPQEQHARPRSIDDLLAGFGDLAPTRPEQSALWRAPATRRREILERIGEGLARRHERVVLLAPVCHAADAVFAEERYRLASALASGGDDLAPTGTEGARVVRKPAAKPTSSAAGDPWRGVPQHLHWW